MKELIAYRFIFARRLSIQAASDRLCPSRGNAYLSQGQVALAIIANRLIQLKARTATGPAVATISSAPRRRFPASVSGQASGRRNVSLRTGTLPARGRPG